MGLNFKKSDVHWAYSGFNDFRRALASEIDINLDGMENFGLPGRSWDSVKDDIVPLLNHPDDSGELTPEECRRVAPRLRELVVEWRDEEIDKIKALRLADDMEALAEDGESLIFC